MIDDAVSESLPDGWYQSELGKVAKWGSGGTPKSRTPAFYDGEIPWAVIGDLTETWVSETAQSITEAGLEKSSAKIIEPGTVMLAMYGASIGRTGIAAVKMATNQAIAFAVPVEGVMDKQFLLKYLQSQKEIFVRAGQGGAQPNISQTVIKPWPVPVPPIAEQIKIVEILEEQLSRLDAALVSIRAIRLKAARFRRSLLHAAFTGALTGGDFALGNIPDGWSNKNVGDFASIKTGKIDVNAAVKDGAYPFFTCAREIYRINEAPYEGRVVLIAGNGELNVKYYEGKFNAYQRTYFLTVLDEAALLPKYLFRFMQMYVEHLRKISIGTTIKYIKLGDLRDASISVPPIALQKKIVQILEEQLSRLESALAVADAIENKASAMRRSLLYAAFTGELTKEWREGANV